MAKNVIAQVLGGEKKILDDVNTVADVTSKLGVAGYTATVNGDQQSPSYELDDGDFVSLSQAVKGGQFKKYRAPMSAAFLRFINS